jgi:RNA polymerase sigma-70 factor (ECF subfamily)
LSVTPTDRELVDGCIAGDRRSWDLFVDRFAGLVHWSIRRAFESSAYLRRRDVLEDVFQDVFRKLVEKEELARLQDVKYLRKFLSVTACHAAIDRMKSLSHRDRVGVSPDEPALLKNGDAAFVADTLASPSAGPDEAFARRESDAIIGDALASLEPRERACIQMHFMDGRSHREIAAILAIPQDTVSTVIRRTREKLKQDFLKKGLAG